MVEEEHASFMEGSEVNWGNSRLLAAVVLEILGDV